MDDQPLTLQSGPPLRRRGRPKGSTSKRSLDLARYIEATFGGMTPGQQMAELAMVKPSDVKNARRRAHELLIVDHGLPPVVLAMVVKADLLAAALGVTRAEAWSAMHSERKELMAYIHQKQAPKTDSKAAAPATAYLIPEGDARPVMDTPGVDGEVVETIRFSPDD